MSRVDKKLTLPPAPKPHPYPLSNGRGDFMCGVESKGTNSIYFLFFVSLSVVSKSIVGLCTTRKQFQ